MHAITGNSQPGSPGSSARTAAFSHFAVALCAAWSFACGEATEPGTAPVRATSPATTETPSKEESRKRQTLDLRAYFDVALIEGEASRAPGGSSSDATNLQQRAGSALTYHFLLPPGARLSGRATARGKPADLRIEVTQEGSGSRTILERSIPAGADPFELGAGLDSYGGQMVALRLSLSGAVSGDPNGTLLEWSALEISGAAPDTGEPFRAKRRPYNVLIVLFDSLRPDFTDPYGDPGGLTPNLAKLAAQGVTFMRARSSASWTRASVAAMFSSLEPEVTGVLDFQSRMPEEAPYLPQILKQAGYRTHGVTSNAMVAAAFGFSRGFDALVQLFQREAPEFNHPDPKIRAGFVWGRFIKRVAEKRNPRPFFVYLHELDPHSPYEAPLPYGAIGDFGYDGDVETSFLGMRALRHSPGESDENDVREVRRRYRAEIAFMDGYVGFLVERLEKTGLAPNTLFVFVSDHGEEFRDHGGIGHGIKVYEEQLRVPLIMRLPGVLPAGRRVEADARLIDLPATILDLTGITTDEPLEGTSLLPAIADATARPPRASYGSALKGTSSVGIGRFKLIRVAVPDEETDEETGEKTGGDASDEETLTLYDLENDPAETIDVAAAHPIATATLSQMLRWKRHQGALRADQAVGDDVPLDTVEPSVRDNLRALGYIE